jgi:hypothetical protein
MFEGPPAFLVRLFTDQIQEWYQNDARQGFPQALVKSGGRRPFLVKSSDLIC